jgi:hypothetical protein
MQMKIIIFSTFMDYMNVYDYTLQFTITHTHTSVHGHIFTSRCSVAASNRGRSLFSGFPKCPRASATWF